MKKAVSGIMLSVLIIGISGLAFNPKPALSSEVCSQEKAPDFMLSDIYGETFCLYDCSARVVLIEFFGTWCAPCVQQIPALRNIYGNYSRDELEMISISQEDEVVLRDFAGDHGIEWIVARDTINLFDQYDLYAVPTSFIIDVQRYIQYERVGLTEESILRSEIDSLLPKTIYVDDDNTVGPWDGTPEHPYQDISSALEHASTNDTIFVYNGTYYENVVVNKTVSLIGENKVTTTIDGDMTATVVAVTADNVAISEFTIRNGGNRYVGMSLSSNGNNITNNIIRNNWCGISLEHYSTYNVIDNNSIMNNLNGISGELWSDSMIIGNTLKDNLLGIWIGPYSSRNTIAFNNIRNHWSEGISMWQSSYNTVVGNNITDNNQGGHWAGIVVGSSSYNRFFHNNIANKGKQIDVQGEVVNTWDDGYPSGGNYWSDYNGTDLFGGPYQNKTGSDGIGDTSYIINQDNQDNYPLMEPRSPIIDITPPTITIISPINGSTFETSINLTAIVSDEKGVDVAWWAIEGIMIGGYFFHGIKNGTYKCSISGLKNGSVISGAYFVLDNGTIIRGEPNQFSATIIDGQQYCIAVFANDTSGNIASSKVYVTKMPITLKTLLGTGWGWMRIDVNESVHGKARLYKIGEEQIELVITYEGDEYSRIWNIIFHKEYEYGDWYLCYSPEWGFLIVGIHKHRRWQFWYAIGRGTLAFGFPRSWRLMITPI